MLYDDLGCCAKLQRVRHAVLEFMVTSGMTLGPSQTVDNNQLLLVYTFIVVSPIGSGPGLDRTLPCVLQPEK